MAETRQVRADGSILTTSPIPSGTHYINKEGSALVPKWPMTSVTADITAHCTELACIICVKGNESLSPVPTNIAGLITRNSSSFDKLSISPVWDR